jgi:hypothetical protein
MKGAGIRDYHRQALQLAESSHIDGGHTTQQLVQRYLDQNIKA